MARISGMCDYFVICSATSKIRARTIAEHVEDEMRDDGVRVNHRDGLKDSDWVILDFSDIVLHVFVGDTRKRYDLESLWGDAPRHLFSDKQRSKKHEK